MASVVRGTSLRAGGACGMYPGATRPSPCPRLDELLTPRPTVRCRKGKTKCVYENGRAPCKNCAKGLHECYLPSESMAHHHGQSPARVNVARPRESLPGAERNTSTVAERPAATTPQAIGTRAVQSNSEK